jgi:hypothetical protein
LQASLLFVLRLFGLVVVLLLLEEAMSMLVGTLVASLQQSRMALAELWRGSPRSCFALLNLNGE